MHLSIYIFGVIQALFLSFMIRTKPERSVPQNWIVRWMMLMALRLIAGFALTTEFAWNWIELMTIIQFTFLLDGPVMYLYTRSLSKSKTSKVVWWLVMSPVIVYLLVSISEYVLISRESLVEQFLSETPSETISEDVFGVVLNLSVVVYPILCFRNIMSYRKQLSENFSFINPGQLRWMTWTLVAWTAGFVIPLVLYLFSYEQVIVGLEELFYNLMVYGNILAIFTLGYLGVKQSPPVVDQAHDPKESATELTTKEPVKYAKSALSEEKLNMYRERLGGYMTKERPYLDPDLTLSQLADDVSMASHHLSQVINGFDANFYEYVNRFRVEHMRVMLEDETNHEKISAIAYDSGFKSKSTFNKCFKEAMGTTPAKYRDNVRSISEELVAQ